MTLLDLIKEKRNYTAFTRVGDPSIEVYVSECGDMLEIESNRGALSIEEMNCGDWVVKVTEEQSRQMDLALMKIGECENLREDALMFYDFDIENPGRVFSTSLLKGLESMVPSESSYILFPGEEEADRCVQLTHPNLLLAEGPTTSWFSLEELNDVIEFLKGRIDEIYDEEIRGVVRDLMIIG